MSTPYYTTIGLEVHAELHTNSKMWCGCKNAPTAEKPNTNICEVCMAHPGTLPVPNKEAIRKVIQVGLAVGANIADFTEFDRKNYFYPDIPKGYQLSQYKLPIVSGGSINGVELTRIHLEEDTAKSSHEGGTTLVDYNRAGVPLMELVTEPVIHSAEQAGEFARALQQILRYVGASEANMELGQMRIEANISVSKDPKKFGTKVEVKNINSFASVEGAIRYEVDRHIALIEDGGAVVQETRGWDEGKLETFSQRKKENAHDYRYFPDPDLPKLYLSKLFDIEAMKKEIPELPVARKARLMSMDLKEEIVNTIIADPVVAFYFDKVTTGKSKEFIKLAGNYLVVDIFGLIKLGNRAIKKVDQITDRLSNDLGREPETEEIAAEFSVKSDFITAMESMKSYESLLPKSSSFATLLEMIEKGKLSSRGAKDLLPLIIGDKTVDVKKTAEEKGLIQKNDPALLQKIVDEVITENPTQVVDYKSGKDSMFMFFVGQCMKKSKGAGNPGVFQELLKAALGN